EDAPFDGVEGLPGAAELLLQQGPLHAAVDHADGDALAGGPGVVQEAVWGQQGEGLLEDVPGRPAGRVPACGPARRRAWGRRAAHGRASPLPVTLSSSRRTPSTSWTQWRTADGPCRRARTRMASASRRVSSGSTAASGLVLRSSRMRSRTAAGGGSSGRWGGGVPYG